MGWSSAHVAVYPSTPKNSTKQVGQGSGGLRYGSACDASGSQNGGLKEGKFAIGRHVAHRGEGESVVGCGGVGEDGDNQVLAVSLWENVGVQDASDMCFKSDRDWVCMWSRVYRPFFFQVINRAKKKCCLSLHPDSFPYADGLCSSNIGDGGSRSGVLDFFNRAADPALASDRVARFVENEAFHVPWRGVDDPHAVHDIFVVDGDGTAFNEAMHIRVGQRPA